MQLRSCTVFGSSIEVERNQVGKIPAWHMAKLRSGGAYLLCFDGGGDNCAGSPRAEPESTGWTCGGFVHDDSLEQH